MARAGTSRRPLAATLVTLLCAAPAAARAQSFQAQAEGGYTNATTTSVDETGLQAKADSSAWNQRYRLSLDETLFPLVKFNANGLLDWNIGSSRVAGVETESDSKTWDGNAHLTWGNPMLSGGLDYDRREQSGRSRTAGVSVTSPGLVRETYGGAASWRPLDLPSLDLRLTRAESFDRARLARDQTTDDASLSTSFEPTKSTELRYTVRYGSFDDHLTGVRTTDVSNSAAVRWSERFLDGRITTYASYTIGTRNALTTVAGTTGTVATQRFPFAGLSIVESGIDTPTHVTLNQNAALVDGNTGNGTPGNASAGVNLGYSARGTLVTPRDLGAQLQNEVTQVSRIDVWLDRNVDPVAAQFKWTAYQSKDNLDWTQFDPALVSWSYDPLLSRFQISIPRTAAKFLKVVTTPIERTLTTDPLFSEIYVTELQLFDVVAAADVRGRSFQLAGTATGSVKVLLLRAPSLIYDFSSTVAHATGPTLVTYAISNGLSAQHRLARALVGSARIDRSDSDAGTGHVSSNRWSGTLGFDPLPTLAATAGYTGQYGQGRGGSTLSHAVTGFGRADLYEGISLSATSSGTWARDEHDRVSRGATASASASIVPNRFLSTSATGSYAYTLQTGGGQPDRTDRRGVGEVSASSSPFPALSLSGSVLRIVSSASGATTLLSFGGGYSPFRGGDLVFSYAYQESLDTAADTRSRTHGPNVRWNIRPGWFFNAGWAFQKTTSPAQSLRGQAITANLVGTYR